MATLSGNYRETNIATIAATLTAALSVFATALETESAYTSVLEVDVTINTNMSN